MRYTSYFCPPGMSIELMGPNAPSLSMMCRLPVSLTNTFCPCLSCSLNSRSNTAALTTSSWGIFFVSAMVRESMMPPYRASMDAPSATS